MQASAPEWGAGARGCQTVLPSCGVKVHSCWAWGRVRVIPTRSRCPCPQAATTNTTDWAAQTQASSSHSSGTGRPGSGRLWGWFPPVTGEGSAQAALSLPLQEALPSHAHLPPVRTHLSLDTCTFPCADARFYRHTHYTLSPVRAHFPGHVHFPWCVGTQRLPVHPGRLLPGHQDNGLGPSEGPLKAPSPNAVTSPRTGGVRNLACEFGEDAPIPQILNNTPNEQNC